jgi:hypothetical protein
MGFQKGQPAEPVLTFYPPIGAQWAQWKKWMGHPPQKHTPEICTKSWKHFKHTRAIAGARRYKEEASHNARLGAIRPRVKR